MPVVDPTYTPAYTPVAGKYGRTSFGPSGTSVSYLNEWNLQARADDLDVSRFDSQSDAEGLYYTERGVGFVDAEVTVGGRFDKTRNPVQAPYKLWACLSGKAFLGINTLFGFTMNYIVGQTTVGQRVRDMANFGATLRNVGVITRPPVSTNTDPSTV